MVYKLYGLSDEEIAIVEAGKLREKKPPIGWFFVESERFELSSKRATQSLSTCLVSI